MNIMPKQPKLFEKQDLKYMWEVIVTSKFFQKD